MSTRSYICRENEDGTYTGIYCHSDGYLSYNGAMLIDHYVTREKVDRLISLGSLSSLQPKLDPDPDKRHEFDPERIGDDKNFEYVYHRQEDVCLFYGRDRGEKDTEAMPIELDTVEDGWIDYCYVYAKDGTWKYFKTYENYPQKTDPIILRDVETDLNAEFEGYGIERPPNEYGYYSPETIAKLKQDAADKKRQSGTGSEM